MARENHLLFPDGIPAGGKTIPTTIDNVEYLLKQAGMDVRYNVIKKKNEYLLPDHKGTSDNLDNVAISTATSLAAKAGLPTGLVPDFVNAVADRNAYNPVAIWIRSRPWDGENRITKLCETISLEADYPTIMRSILVTKWLRSAAAAVTRPDFRNRGVLTLQGPQGCGKTSWVRSLVDDSALCESVVKLDHHLDGSNKDSIIGAITNWIVEIGELDSSFRKDIARLKGFLTNDKDRVRRPYARTESEYRRLTVFIATVNDANFLTDHTGNSRWWSVGVERLDFNHGLDMQQVFAQALNEVEAGEIWWLDEQEEIMLASLNRRYQTVSAIAEVIGESIDLSRYPDPNDEALTPTQVLGKLGFKLPISNPHAKEAGAVLRELLGKPKRIQGRDKWRVPFTHVDPGYWSKTKNEKPDIY